VGRFGCGAARRGPPARACLFRDTGRAVSLENVDVVRAIYERWLKEESAADLIEDDMEYVNPPDAVESGTRKGRRTLAKIREVYPDFRIEPERYIDAGDDVVVIGIARGTGASGVEVQWRQGYIWTIEDGKAIRMRWFNQPKEALAAAGIEE
jgi:ketosteroid isomerase-like protein